MQIDCKKIFFHGSKSEFRDFALPIGGTGLADCNDGFGIHFGTLDQAMRFGDHIAAVHLDVRNAIELPDLGAWFPDVFAGELLSQGLLTDEEVDGIEAIAGREGDAIANTHIVQHLVAKGFDAIIYDNQFEGAGKSIAVFSPAQVRLIKWFNAKVDSVRIMELGANTKPKRLRHR